ncbi:MAG: hypothetical protein ACPLQP_04625 [Moorellaceae bacterium]
MSRTIKEKKEKPVNEDRPILEAVWLPDGRYVCPQWMRRDTLQILDYGLARDHSKGMFWFLVE